MVDVREIENGELERWLEIAGAVRPQGTAEEQLDWRRQADDLAWFIAEEDGRDVGAARAVVGWHTPRGVGLGEAFVLPGHRGHGIGTALYSQLARWVAERGCIELMSAVSEDDAESIAWAERRGFRQVARNSRLVLDLEHTDAPAVDPPEGVEVVSWAARPDLAHGLYDVYREAEPDIPSGTDGAEEPPPFERWLSREMEGPGDRPEAVFVAVSGSEVVGYAKLALSGSRPGVALHDITGVKRAWRGKGIAGALKRAQIRWAKENGLTRLETQNEERNEPIRRLNARHGYREEPGEVVLTTTLAAPE